MPCSGKTELPGEETMCCYKTSQNRTQRVRVWVGTKDRERPHLLGDKIFAEIRGQAPRMLSHTLLLLFNCDKTDMGHS